MPTSNGTTSLACDLCGESEARIRYVTRSYGKGSTLLVIENVPTITCPSCGESFLTADTLHELERIKRHRRSLAKNREVAVANFPRSA